MISVVIGGIIFLGVFQDFIHAKIYSEGFYFSESFIFKSFWVLFIPLTFLISFLVKKRGLKIDILSLVKLFLISTLHIFFSALIIVGLYDLLLEIDFSLFDVFKGLFGSKLYISLLVLGIIIFIFNHKIDEKSLEFLSIKDGRTIYNIAINTVVYVKANTPYITIVSENKRYTYNTSLIKFLSSIDNPNFIRIHKKYIINKDFILN